MMSLPILPIRRVFQRCEIIFPRQPRSPAKPKGARRLWAIENRLQWIPDITFRDDQSRQRTAHGAKKMATVMVRCLQSHAHRQKQEQTKH